MTFPLRIIVALAVTGILPIGPAHAEDVEKGPRAVVIDRGRFGGREPDAAFGAYQRGLYITAFNLAQTAAEAGDAAAQTLLGELYSRGLGIPRDIDKALGWYARAAEKGDREALFQYGMALIDGTHLERNEEEAFEYLRRAADKGHVLAQFNFAQLALKIRPSAAGIALAVDYYEKAAMAGLPDAEYALAQVYDSGVGGRSRDLREARKWLEKAAAQNFDTAQLDLATWLIEGHGGERDLEAGFAWMRAAARSGNVVAQSRLAKLYWRGLGTKGDPVSAAAWYIIARRAGLTDPELNVFLEGLTSEQQKEAIELANRLR